MPAPSALTLIANPCILGKSVSFSYTKRQSWFMKWLRKLFKSCAIRDGSGSSVGSIQNPQFKEEENMFWHRPPRFLDDRFRTARDREKHELDHAMGMSLPEGFKRPRGFRWRTGFDDVFPRPFPGRPNFPVNPPYVPTRSFPMEYRICSGCNREIGNENYLGCIGTFFHPQCFRCHSCGHPITEPEFSLSGKVPYHKSCFKHLSHPKCEVCDQFIPVNYGGLIEYRCHPFWSQKYCPVHEHDKTARCCSCERLESWSARHYSLQDGRSLCLECMESAIMDTGECQPLYHAIRDYYEGMNMKLDQQIPMLLVERQALNEAIVGEKHAYHHMPETRGLCLSEEQTVSSVQRRPRIGGSRFVGMRTQPQKLLRRCEVTAILVLYGLPRLLTGAILAHELMHGWLRFKGYRNLSPEVEEGICQVLSYMWLESEVLPGSRNMPSTSTAAPSSSSNKKGGKSYAEEKLGEFFLHQIAHDASPAYGGGFRAGNAAVSMYGLRTTLEHIRLTGTFPL